MIKKIDLIIENCLLPDSDTGTAKAVSIACSDGVIMDVDEPRQITGRYTYAERYNGDGRVIFPGFINTHTHTFQTLLKGIAKDKPLLEWLAKAIRASLHHLSDEALYTATLLACMDAISSGTTTILDYAYASVSAGSMDAVSRAMRDIGIRGILARGFSEDVYGKNDKSLDLSEPVESVFESFLQLRERNRERSVGSALAPTAVWNFTEKGLESVASFAREYSVPLTMHVNETELDNQFCRERYGCGCTGLLERTGCLDISFLAVHCVEMEREDIERFARKRVSVSYNPVSNMLLGSGIPPMKKMQEAGIHIAMGTDGAGSNDTQNMLDTVRFGSLLQKGFYRDPTIFPAGDMLRMATVNGAKALGLESVTGSISAGKAADFMLCDFSTSAALPVRDPASAMVYQADRTNVSAVFVRGVCVYEGGRFTRIDQDAVLGDAERLARAIGG
jgi:5-methylthioadenosine/S-adenosylhomocysteine deaminase